MGIRDASVMHTSLEGQQVDLLILVLKKELSNKAFLIHRAGYCIKLDMHQSKDKEDTGGFEINLMF